MQARTPAAHARHSAVSRAVPAGLAADGMRSIQLLLLLLLWLALGSPTAGSWGERRPAVVLSSRAIPTAASWEEAAPCALTRTSLPRHCSPLHPTTMRKLAICCALLCAALGELGRGAASGGAPGGVLLVVAAACRTSTQCLQAAAAAAQPARCRWPNHWDSHPAARSNPQRSQPCDPTAGSQPPSDAPQPPAAPPPTAPPLPPPSLLQLPRASPCGLAGWTAPVSTTASSTSCNTRT